MGPYPSGIDFFSWSDTVHLTHDFSEMQGSDFILAVGCVGRHKLARLDVSHPYQRAFLNRGLVRTHVIDEEADLSLDQATMYAAGLVMMVLHEMADVADTLENRVFRNMDMQDIRMNEVEREVELAKDEIVNNHDKLLQAQVDIGDLRYRNRALEDWVSRLEEQVRDLMAFRMVLQHGPGNLIVVEDDEDEVEVVEDSEPGREVLIEEMTPAEIREVREMTPGEYVRRLIPIDEIEADEEIWEDERAFRRDRLTEDINPVPGYPEPPEYVPPPVYDE